eukprot:15348816-Ditylum_brightwellii.AAC.1
MHSDIFEDIAAVFSRLTTREHLKEILHKGSTQRNEGVNNSINTKAPKTCVYSSINSLMDRVNTMIGIHNLGHE